MIATSTADLATALGMSTTALGPAGDATVTGVVTDSRIVASGDLYVARQGEHADGADFAADAMARGAVAAIATREIPGVPTIVVDDADAALTAIATWVRDTVDPRVVAVTGSVGKTTTKDLVAAAVAPSHRVVAAVGSYNNDVGVPLTVVRTTQDTEVLVAELGARGVGQVARLCGWLRPDVAIVTAVAGVHMELFGSLEQIAVAKGELVESLPANGVAVLNHDDTRVAGMASRTSARVLAVSATGATGADVVAQHVRLDARARAAFTAVTPWGDHEVHLPIAGRHHVGNALLALAAAGAVDADVTAAAAALGSAPVSGGRSRIVAAAGVTVVDDSYNANPTSTMAALDTLASMDLSGDRIAVLGVMAEIGDDHDAEHRRVGAHAATALDRLVVVGDAASGIAGGARSAGLASVVVVADAAGAIEHLRQVPARAGDGVLVKASRVEALDRVVEAMWGTGAESATQAGPEQGAAA